MGCTEQHQTWDILPDRYIILLSYLRLPYVYWIVETHSTSFSLSESRLRLYVGQMCVHHMCLSEWLLSRYYVNPANNLYVFYFGELINIRVMFQFNTVLRLQLQRVCELRPTTSLGSGRGSGSTRATTRPKFLQQPMSKCYNGYMVNKRSGSRHDIWPFSKIQTQIFSFEFFSQTSHTTKIFWKIYKNYFN